MEFCISIHKNAAQFKILDSLQLITILLNLTSAMSLFSCFFFLYTILGEYDCKISFGQLRRFSWREIQLATDNFDESNIIGQGGFGRVYRGVLSDNVKIAVKRLTDYNSPGGEAAFLREVQLISVAVHRNLLRLIGFCTTASERVLVYPFMKNLSVAYRLRGMFPKAMVILTGVQIKFVC